MSDNRVSESS